MIAGKTGIFVGGLCFSSGTYSIDTFVGSIVNVGTISAAEGLGIVLGGHVTTAATFTISTFAGGLTNVGTVSARPSAIEIGHILSFTGGVSNNGKIVSVT